MTTAFCEVLHIHSLRGWLGGRGTRDKGQGIMVKKFSCFLWVFYKSSVCSTWISTVISNSIMIASNWLCPVQVWFLKSYVFLVLLQFIDIKNIKKLNRTELIRFRYKFFPLKVLFFDLLFDLRVSKFRCTEALNFFIMSVKKHIYS